MPDYSKGKIYKIISNLTDKAYFGSTTNNYLSNRLAKHMWDFKNNCHLTSFEILKFNDAKIILIENFPCSSKDELRQREQFWIDQNKDICINKNNSFRRDMEKRKLTQKILNKKHSKKRGPKICYYCGEFKHSAGFAKHCKSTKHKDAVEFANRLD